MVREKELLWEKEKYSPTKTVSINLNLQHWGTKHYLIRSFLQPRKGDQILDIGCGYGTTLLTIQKLIKSGVGIDVSKTAINRARIISRKLGAKNLSFIIGNANHITFRDENFTKIICFDVAEHMVEPKNLFAEINRLLSSGGKALVYTNFYGKFCWGFLKEYIQRRGHLQKLWLRDKDVLHLNRFTENQFKNYFRNSNCRYRLVFKNHWLTPILLDIVALAKKINPPKNNPKTKHLPINFSANVPWQAKIQYYLSVSEMRLLSFLPAEGVFVLIEKVPYD